MKWEKEAEQEIKKVPFFIRKRVKKIIEKRIAEKGLTSVSFSELNSARIHFFKKMDQGNPHASGEEIKLSEVKTCRGEEVNCPFMIENALSLSKKIVRIMEKSEFTKKRMAKAEGLILPHHKFKLSISTCPNGCSQPQIKDMGVLLQAIPGKGEGECNNCRLCLETCKEDALQIVKTPAGFEPKIDFSHCLNCGMCVRVCPTKALAIERTGYKLLAGGRLGRHPQLAKEILIFCEEDELLSTIQRMIEAYLRKADKEAKLADLLPTIILTWTS